MGGAGWLGAGIGGGAALAVTALNPTAPAAMAPAAAALARILVSFMLSNSNLSSNCTDPLANPHRRAVNPSVPSLEIEPVVVHDLVPRAHEVSDEPILGIRLRVYLGERA
ncbi:hypothetical protein BN978_07238 [Mycolicibacterium mageritense DSM 44476 = CIP 104973]|nr:hypothetical protein BN978_07238 [Mycolicibacterium mageritense DSM 44476 = CIP 104973]